MAQWHLGELRAALEKRGWTITELPGDDYKIAGTWELRRPRDERVLHIDFDGFDDMWVLPMDRSAHYEVRGTDLRITISPWRNRKHSWRPDLQRFVQALEPLKSAHSPADSHPPE